jgi:hypothetical protein
MTYIRSWKSLRLTSHTWLGLNPQIGRPLSRIVVPLVHFFLFFYILDMGPGADWPYNEVGKIPRGPSSLGTPKAIGGPPAS